MNEQRNHDSSNDKREKKKKIQRVCLLQLRLFAKQFSSAARRHRLSFGRRLIFGRPCPLCCCFSLPCFTEHYNCCCFVINLFACKQKCIAKRASVRIRASTFNELNWGDCLNSIRGYILYFCVEFLSMKWDSTYIDPCRITFFFDFLGKTKKKNQSHKAYIDSSATNVDAMNSHRTFPSRYVIASQSPSNRISGMLMTWKNDQTNDKQRMKTKKNQ